MAQAFQDLIVWQRSMEMTVVVYDLTSGFPKAELYGLSSQLRRAAVSVTSNIAEGRGRETQGEFRQFLAMAQGSNYEVQTQLLVAKTLGFGNQAKIKQAERLSIEVGKMISSLLATIQLKAKS